MLVEIFTILEIPLEVKPLIKYSTTSFCLKVNKLSLLLSAIIAGFKLRTNFSEILGYNTAPSDFTTIICSFNSSKVKGFNKYPFAPLVIAS